MDQGLPQPDATQPTLRHRELVRLAESQADERAWLLHRERVRQILGAPVRPSRGTPGCLSLVLIPLGLVLLTVHPLPGTLTLSLAAAFYLAGSTHLSEGRQRLESADAEAARSWQEKGSAAAPQPFRQSNR